jgi:hypothetical protein
MFNKKLPEPVVMIITFIRQVLTAIIILYIIIGAFILLGITGLNR